MLRFDDARKIDEEAIALYRQLYKKNPEEYRGDFARCLSQYADMLDNLGKISEWRLALEERQVLLADVKPSPSSNSLALNDLGRVKEAPVVLEEQKVLKTERSMLVEREAGEESSLPDE